MSAARALANQSRGTTAPVGATFDGATLAIASADLTKIQRDELVKLASCPNPAYLSALDRGRVPFRLAPRIDLFREEGGRMFLPAALAREVARVVSLAVPIDTRPTFEPRAIELRRELRAHQRAALAALLAARGGVCLAPTGSGKSALIVALVAHYGVPALVIVPTKDLVAQLVQTARDWLGVEAGVLADGKRSIGEVLTVATPQGALAALDLLRGRVGLVIVDEAHHAGAATYRELLSRLPRRRTVGLTATPRQDALWRAVVAHVGPVVHEVPRAALERAGLLVVPSYRAVETGWSFDYTGPEDWIALQASLEVDADRRDLVANAFAGAVRGRGLGLLLCGRVEYSKLLAVELRARGLRAAALVGAMPAKERSATLDAARAGKLDVLTATSLADEGLDLPDLRVLGLAWPSRAEPRLLQRIGRVLRPSEGKSGALVIDFVDAAGPLENQGRIRSRLFAKHWGRS